MTPSRTRGGCYENRWLPSSRVAIRLALRLGLLGALVVGVGVACAGGEPSRPVPRPVLASSQPAQAEFRRLQVRWLQGDRQERAALEQPWRDFLRRFSDDDRARLARVYLAWILIGQKQLDEARALVEQSRAGPTGSARDFASVTEAAILIRLGQPEGALQILLPLQGKIIDADERLLFGEQLVQAALGGRRWRRALGYMFDWLAEAAPEHRDAIGEAITRQLTRIPASALERSLASLDEEAVAPAEAAVRAPARDWLRTAVRFHLARLAIEQSDVALARRLLASGLGGLRRSAEGEALVALAARGDVAPRVVGRTVGLVLTVSDATTRQRSAAVALSMSRALGLPAAAARPEAVRLLTRDDSAEEEGITRALAELAGEGAVILVAGVAGEGAARAAEFAQRARIPVLLLARVPTVDPKGFAFQLGADEEQVREVLKDAVGESGPVVLVGAGGTSCDLAPAAAGGKRFPIDEWRRSGTRAVLLGGDGACARQVLAELTRSKLRPTVVFSLECGEVFAGARTSLDLRAVAAGHFPVSADEPPPPSLRDWVGATGSPPSFYHVLGHDAALLSAAALASLPVEQVDDAREVAAVHARVRGALAQARAALWSTERRGFDGGRVLERTLRVISRADGARP